MPCAVVAGLLIVVGLASAPQAASAGPDLAFTSTVSDGRGGTDEGTVTVTAIGCGEDGHEALHRTPLDGLLSGTIDREIEPVAGSVDPGSARSVHQANCEIVVPAEGGSGSP